MAQSNYRVVMLPPPGSIVAPHGFPANPRPEGAPKLFLDAMDVRIKVFCDEQNCALGPELDEDDPRSFHWVVYYTGGPGPDQPVSVIRIVPPPHGSHPNSFHDPHEEPYVKLGRVASMPEFRRRGLTRMVSEEAFRWHAANSGQVGGGWKGLVLTHAQVDVEKMYEKMGFVTDDKLGRWDEEGIEHLGMWKRLDAVP
ncbi:hypothetical protein PV11_03817 [Exophiala sideris]|uniref:N-acetyltransferase domain-containing protein n=1 Tax=Exophiala sideris TaxID=1016849 RepID=A0A0D1YFG9_9EURO|nr:hypothetical protein PV11_03817 [Exophiala sideris]